MKQKCQNQLNDQLQGLRKKEEKRKTPLFLAWTNGWVVGSLIQMGKTGEADPEGKKMSIFQHIGLEVPESYPGRDGNSSEASKEFRIG